MTQTQNRPTQRFPLFLGERRMRRLFAVGRENRADANALAHLRNFHVAVGRDRIGPSAGFPRCREEWLENATLSVRIFTSYNHEMEWLGKLVPQPVLNPAKVITKSKIVAKTL